MASKFLASALALGALFCAVSSALAQQLPAVSAVNGKFEFDAGLLSLPSPGFMGRAAGTLTVPVGDRFGLQLDASVASAPGLTSSAALHGFTRDPQSYLIGGALGIIRTPGATVFAAGPEAELYFDRWTLEAWAGVSYARPTAGPNRLAPLVMANLGYYLNDNARLTVGLSTLDGYGAIQFGGEYMLSDFDLPISVTAETRVGQDGAWRGMLGLRGYLGPENKTLLRRQREDDPADRSSALYTSAGGETIRGANSPAAGSSGSNGEPGIPDPDANTPPTSDPFGIGDTTPIDTVPGDPQAPNPEGPPSGADG